MIANVIRRMELNTLHTSTKVVALVSVLGAVFGLISWVYQQWFGLGATGMNNGTSWGLYIADFMYFVGLSAGAQAIACAGYAFNIKSLRSISIPSAIVALVMLCMGGLSVLVDLGGIERVFHMFLSPNFASPLVWDMTAISVCLILDVLFLAFLLLKKERQAILLARILVLSFFGLLSVDAWIFGLENAKEGWNSAILAPIFICSALDSGAACVALCLAYLEKQQHVRVEKHIYPTLALIMVVAVVFEFYFIMCEVVTTAYAHTATGTFILGQMFVGSTAPFFWFEIIGGLVIPFFLMISTKRRASKRFFFTAGVLVMIGVFCKRIWLLLSSFVKPNVYGAPGLTSGSVETQGVHSIGMWSPLSYYAPSISEIGVTCAMVGIALLALIILFKLCVPLHEPIKD